MNKILIAMILVVTGCSRLTKSGVLSLKPAVANTKSDAAATVMDVTTMGNPNNYTFAVKIGSYDTGCDDYADWWEVITPEGELLYRRVLLHSHVDEQPFTRTGSPIPISPQQEVIVRVHTSADGYSALAQQGTPALGFTATTLPPEFAPDLESVEPLPQDCAF